MDRTSKRAIDILKQNKLRKEQGLVNCIPFSYDRLSDYIPGIQRKNYTLITASTGVGKSKFAKVSYVIQAYEFVKAHAEMGIKLKIFYFCLEESKENFLHSVICYKLMTDFKKRVDIKQLKSIGKNNTLDDETLDQVEQMQRWLEEFEEVVEITDTSKNPTGIFKKVENYMLEHGRWITHPVVTEGKTYHVKDHFIHNHPEHYVVVLIDHISLIHVERGVLNKHEAITKLSSLYLMELRDKYLCSIVVVQQQSADKEKQEYTYRGQSIEAKLEPSLDGLADNKLTGRDADEVIGLFAPDRYEIENHRGYNIVHLQDNYRSGSILKSRDGTANIRIGLFFDGASNQFAELPKVSAMTREHYEYYLNRVGRTLQTQRRINFNTVH